MIYNNEFTHEIVIPSDENDDEDIKDVLEEHKQEKYIEGTGGGYPQREVVCDGVFNKEKWIHGNKK